MNFSKSSSWSRDFLKGITNSSTYTGQMAMHCGRLEGIYQIMDVKINALLPASEILEIEKILEPGSEFRINTD